jgi:hypothetical protein
VKEIDKIMNKIQKVVQVWLPILILLGVTKLLSATSGITLRQLMVDPTEVMRVPFYIGIVADIGVLLWAATVSICLFISVFLAQWVGKAWRNFFLVSGLLTLVLLLDDLLRIHDEIFPVYFGIKGDFIGIVYVLLVSLYLLRYRTLIFQQSYDFLVMALGFFALSVAIDVAPTALKEQFFVRDILLLEDGAKLLGIANWLAYFGYLGASVLGKANHQLSGQQADDQTQGATSNSVGTRLFRGSV